VQAGRDIWVAKQIQVFQTTAASLSPSLHQLPALTAVFTGRDKELADLENELCANDTTATSIKGAGLQGMPGTGKTTLAVALAHRIKDRYPDAQLFLNLRGANPEHQSPVAPVEVMQRVIHSFHPDAQVLGAGDEIAPIYCSVLADAGRVLLLFDNVADAAQLKPLLPPSNCLLLFTSRKQFQISGFTARNIACLPRRESRELLLKIAPRLTERAEEAAQLCADLPLALEAFAGAVNDKSLTPVDKLIERLRAKLEGLAPFEAAFQVSFDLLDTECRRKWTLLAVFPGTFDLLAATAIWQSPIEAARDVMQLLVNASLVESNDTDGRCRLHDLVRQFCDSHLTQPERDAARLRHARHFVEIGEAADKLYEEHDVIRGLQLFDRERANIEAAFEWLQSRSDSECTTLLMELVAAVTHTSHLRFHPYQNIRWREAQRRAARAIRRRDHEGAALMALGDAHLVLGNPRKATEFHQEALAIFREIGDRRAEGYCLYNLGSSYLAVGDAPKAAEFYASHLTLSRDIGDRLGEGGALAGLGNAYLTLGDARKAGEMYEEALVIFHEIGDLPRLGKSLCNLGHAYLALGDAPKAIQSYEQALIIDREIHNRRSEGAALMGLGNAYLALDDVHKAIASYEEALVILREVGDRLGEGRQLGNLGDAYQALGEIDKAIDFYEKALVILREVGQRAEEGKALRKLGKAWARLGDERKSVEFYDRALIIDREIGNRSSQVGRL
jgi:tetratricopeptide (TPR) repeat protein